MSRRPAPHRAGAYAAESLTATASFERRWLLLEVAGAWGPNAFRDSPLLDPLLGARVQRPAAAARLIGRSRDSYLGQLFSELDSRRRLGGDIRQGAGLRDSHRAFRLRTGTGTIGVMT